MAATDTREREAYATVAVAFWAVFGGFVLTAGDRLPERIGFGDMARIGLAGYKISRLVAKEEVTSFVRAPVTEDPQATEPKREGVARVLGELVTCPYCMGVWVSSALAYSLVLFPRPTRLATTIFGAQAIADFLNAAFVKTRGAS